MSSFRKCGKITLCKNSVNGKGGRLLCGQVQN